MQKHKQQIMGLVAALVLVAALMAPITIAILRL